jgi:multiple sugar transport system ATP-binding protein
MGRAIVRHPQAFLMDEPLSNLDAKLRVQMRSEIARIQNDLGVTTIYVTHDQTEAMTMGDRVAVLRKGVLQQVDTPQELYDHPVNLFVAGFIGSPAMNLFDATVVADGTNLAVEFGGFRVPIPESVLAARPALRAFVDRVVVVGIRPEDMEDASLVGGDGAPSLITSTVELREALGSDVVVHVGIDAPPAMTDDMRELASDVGLEALEQVEQQAAGGRTTLVARLNPRSTVAKGEPIALAVDASRLHFFDADHDTAIYT